jgi:trk system potassium uptake protein TrkH
MLLFGVNYVLYILAASGKVKRLLKDEELHAYLGTILIGTILISVTIYHRHDAEGPLQAICDGAFQVVSMVTTTGFTVADFTMWSSLPVAILFLLMICGGCMGTTSGGIKIARFLILYKNIRRTMLERLQPNRVMVLRLNGKTLSESTLHRILTFATVYVMIVVASFLIISADPANHSMDTNISAVIACINNVGPGLSEIGPAGSYTNFNVLSKLVMIFDMLAGRLEFYPLAAIMAGVIQKK